MNIDKLRDELIMIFGKTMRDEKIGEDEIRLLLTGFREGWNTHAQLMQQLAAEQARRN